MAKDDHHRIEPSKCQPSSKVSGLPENTITALNAALARLRRPIGPNATRVIAGVAGSASQKNLAGLVERRQSVRKLGVEPDREKWSNNEPRTPLGASGIAGIVDVHLQCVPKWPGLTW